MSMTPTNPELLNKPLAETVPAIGGLDLLTPKTGVNPGTLQECINYEISRESGYKLADGLMRYAGKSYNVVKRPVCGDYSKNPPEYIMVGDEQDVDDDAISLFEQTGEAYGDVAVSLVDTLRLPVTGMKTTDGLRAPFRKHPTEDIVLYGYNTTDKSEAQIYIISYPDLTIVDSIVIDGDVFDLSWHSSGDFFVAGTSNAAGTVALYSFDGSSATLEQSLDISTTGGSTKAVSVAFHPTADLLVASGSGAADADRVALLTFNDATPALTEVDTGVQLGAFINVGHSGLVWHSDGDVIYGTVVGGAFLAPIDTGTNTIGAHTFDDTVGFTFSPSYGLEIKSDNSKLANVAGVVNITKTAFGAETDIVAGTALTYNYNNSSLYIASGTSILKDTDDDSAASATVTTGFNGLRAIISLDNPARTDLYLGGEYRVAKDSSPSTMIGTIKPIYISPDETGMCYQIVSGTDSNLYNFGESLRVYSDRNNTDAYVTITNQALKTYTDVQDYIDSYFTHNSGLAADDFRPPGSGPITALFELDDNVYAVRDNVAGTEGVLYKTTDLTDLAQVPAWEAIDMGDSLDYDGGRNPFITLYDQEFISETADPEPPTVDALGSIAESYHTVESAAFTNGSARATPWEDRSNVFLDDDAATTAQVGPSTAGTWNQRSHRLKVTGFNIGEDIDDPVAIAGVTVEVRAKFRGYLTNLDDADVRMKTAQLTGVEGSDNKADVTIYSMGAEIDGAGTDYETAEITYTLGGSTDTWNMTDGATESVFASGFGVELDFECRFRNSNSSGGSSTPQVYFSVYTIKTTVHYTNSTQRVYFWNGTTDVAEADVIGYSVVDGSFEHNNASGNVTLYDIVNPENIVADLEIRSDENGAGIYYADTDGTLIGGTFPSWAEMEAEGSLTQTIKANFYIDEDKEAIYGVTGAGPAFMFDGDFLQTVRAPIAIAKDKPRHIAEHQQHLVLGYKSGSILVSVAGEPTNFAGVEGASEFGFGDNVTGLINLNGNALGIFCRESTHALIGTSIDNFTQQIISKSTGAIEYSVADMGQPIYCDFRGTSNLAATERYGDFSWGRTSQMVTDWIQPRLQEAADFSPGLGRVKLAIPVRNKNQYKLFFNDGYILTLTPFGPQGDVPMFTIQNFAFTGDEDMLPDRTYVPSAALSTVLSNGQELNMIGTEDGDIYVMGQGTGILTNSELIGYNGTMVFNPFNGGAPHLNLKYHEVMVHGLSSGAQELTFSAGVNYLVPEPTAFDEARTMGAYTDAVNLDRIPDRISTHLPNVTDGFSLKIESVADGNLPHTINALTFRPTPLGDRNSAPKTY